MNANFPHTIDWIFLVSCIAFFFMFLYQAWVNLFYTQISKCSIDALLVFLLTKFGSQSLKKQVTLAARDQNRVLLLGIYAVLSCFGAAYVILEWLKKYNATK